MLIRKPEIPSSEITPESVYLNRRQFLGASAAALAGAAVPTLAACDTADGAAAAKEAASDAAPQRDELTPLEDVTGYNNFYEFGTDKEDPARNAPRTLRTSPWTVVVDGLCDRPGRYGFEEFVRGTRQVDRTYRLRCVEAWSMVIPWSGIPLRDVIARARPRPVARFVEFTTLHDPQQMPGQRRAVLQWPYVEGLRLDEANAPPRPAGHGAVRPCPAGAERRADPAGGAVEVRLQVHQVHRPHPLHGPAAAHGVERVRAAGIRLLRQREPRRGPSALEPGPRAPHRRVAPPAHADVQRLQRSRQPVQRP